MPDLSRDGKRVAYIAVHAGREELWTKSLESGREILLASDNFQRSSPRWSPDGTRLAYERFNTNTSEHSLVILPTDGGNEELITSATNTAGFETPEDWSNDGNWILSSCALHTAQARVCMFPVPAHRMPKPRCAWSPRTGSTTFGNLASLATPI